MKTQREQDSNYLSHHGVKGMKWGVRKKEPHSSIREASINKQRSMDRTQKQINRYQRKLNLLNDRKSTLNRHKKAAIKNSELELKYRKQTNLGKRVVQNILFGSVGAETYRLARAKGKNRVEAAFTPTSWYGELKNIKK